MGLIKAILGAAGGVLADQWKEYFYCEAMPADILATKGQKRTSGRSSNTKGFDNVITSGSVVAVADGQCMMIVEQGKVVEVCAEPGEYTFDASTEPSIFAGPLGESIVAVFKNIGKRFTFGGEAPKDQRVYYFNTKEIMGNKFGTPTPIPFRFVDDRIGLDMDLSIRCNGIYSYRIADPITFYTNICGNISADYHRSELDNTLKTEFISALQPAFAKLSALKLRPNELIAHNEEVEQAMNGVLSEKWGTARGLKVGTVALGSVSLPEDEEKMIQDAQKAAMYRDPTMAAATLVGAQADAMRAAAENEGGAMTGFMGLGMAGGAGGLNANDLFAMGAQQAKANPAPKAPASADTWTCACGTKASGNFCPECGAKRPAEGWTCTCGTVNKGKFCTECGAKKPAGVPQYKCDKCGWEPEKGAKPPKFCPECGDPFDDGDVK